MVNSLKSESHPTVFRCDMFKRIPTSTLLIIAFILITVSISLIIVPYMFYRQFYTPKSNSSFGYAMPYTLEGWIILITALILLALGIILIVICVLRPQKESRLPYVNMGPKY
jgi:heme/copper-type cytochrome/quinol oxidase subunit 2